MTPRIHDIDDAERWAGEILPSVSRTFALSIRFLPGTLGRAVTTAYLLCRIADTIEDDGAMDAERKAGLFDEFRGTLGDAEAADAFPARVADVAGDAAHVALIRRTDAVCCVLRSLSAGTRAIVVRWVEEMVEIGRAHV